MTTEDSNQKPKPTLDDIRGPIMRLDASRRDAKDQAALSAKQANRQITENTKPPQATQSEKREE